MPLNQDRDTAQILCLTRRRRKPEIDEIGDIALTHTRQHDFAAAALYMQSVDNSRQRVAAARVRLRSKCANQQNTRRFGPLGERCHPVERRCVTPMEVFEAKNQGALGGCRFEHICQLTQHALPGCPSDRTPQRCVTLWRQQRGQLRQPTRGISFEHGHETSSTGLAAQSHECLEERLIWLADTVVL